MKPRSLRLLPIGFGLLLLLAAEAGGAELFKIYLAEPGVYRVRYDDLTSAALGDFDRPDRPVERSDWSRRELATAHLGLSSQGRAVPIWIEDGGDGSFGSGDWFEFVGDHLAGEGSYFNPHSKLNLYWLDTNQEAPARLRAAEPPADRRGAAPARAGHPRAASAWTAVERHEREQVLLRYPGETSTDHELWYWAKLTQLDPEPFAIDLELPQLDRASASAVELRVQLRGWSRPAKKVDPAAADHRVELLLNGTVVAEGEWNGVAEPVTLAARLQPQQLASVDNRLALRVPARPQGAGGDLLVDVVVLNWVELTYPRTALIDAPARLAPVPGNSADFPGSLTLSAAHRGRSLAAYTDHGVRAAAADGRLVLAAEEVGAGLWAVPGEERRQPLAIELDAPSNWASPELRADYLLITHSRLREALLPLAEFHRSRGLEVAVIEVGDLYDEFNHGVVDPHAIRDFIAYAYQHWQPPRPRFVLLAGDASWDSRNEREAGEDPDAVAAPAHGTRFARVEATPYAEAARPDGRNLIPAWNYGTYDGHAAGDNGFVTVDGDDFLPDLAIGRFPVVEPEEAAAIVAKTIRYMTASETGSWQRSILWISNEHRGFQAWTDQLASKAQALGFGGEKVYPPDAAAAGPQDQARLRAAWDRGHLLVHFVGHGGRFIWRTGPPDYRDARDLFNLEDIDLLAVSDRLPVVLGMTCYSAPFDHPIADSIGEKFLRASGKGAVAVLAASWRYAPSVATSERLITELLEAATVGEALRRAKGASRDQEFIEQFNLLGDPALELALPQPIAVTAGHELAVPPSPPALTSAPAAAIPQRPAPQDLPAAPPATFQNTLRWSTASEVDNFAFDIYRAENEEGPFVRLTEKPIRGGGTTDEVSRYLFVDRSIDPRKTYFYYVESISLAGVRERFTPLIQAPPKLPAGS